MSVWLDHLGSQAQHIYPALRCILVGGEAVSDALLKRLARTFPKAEVIELYGPTEATIISSYYAPARHGDSGVSNCIGHRFDYSSMLILNEAAQLQPLGVVGELYLGGETLAQGYLKRPELTRASFQQICVQTDTPTNLYKTGDLARYLPNGTIEFLGRNDQQVKIRGFRIELGEIQAHLQQMEAIAEVVVQARDGATDKRLIAWYTSQSPVPVEDMRAHLNTCLPDYMIPAAFVHMEAWPLTPNGKIDRKTLPEPDAVAFGSNDFHPPQGEAEQTLAAIWRDLLGIERIGRNDHFFELGGHSLMAVTLVERMRQLGHHIDVRTVFTSPTLAGLAAVTHTIEEIRL